MSAARWLDDRADGVPHALSDTLASRLSDPEGVPVADALVRAASEQLSAVLATTPMSRAQALDLLAADAFATYALEAASEDPATLDARAAGPVPERG